MKYFTYLILLVFLWSCQSSNSNNDSENGRSDDSQTVVSDSNHFLKKYDGKIGEYPIEMVLTNWGDGFINGRYWYKKESKAIEISGEMVSEKEFLLAEYIDEAENGFFKGSIESSNHLRGIWTSSDKSKVYEFELNATSEKAPNDIWSGNWYLNEIWDGGVLLMGNYSEDSIEFALTIFRSGHTGIAEGKANFVQNKAIFYTDLYDEEEGCKLVFEHQGDHILLDQRGSNFGCGFGMRAFAGGRYDNKLIEKKASLTYGLEAENVFQTQEMHDAFKELVGDKLYDLFAFNMQYSEVIEIHELDNFATRAVVGFVQGFFTSNEAIIMNDESGKFWAATIDINENTGENVVRYCTNAPSKSDNLPATINDWRDNFMDYPIIIESFVQ